MCGIGKILFWICLVSLIGSSWAADSEDYESSCAVGDDVWFKTSPPKTLPPSLRNRLVQVTKTTSYHIGNKNGLQKTVDVVKRIFYPKESREEEIPQTVESAMAMLNEPDEDMLSSMFWKPSFGEEFLLDEEEEPSPDHDSILTWLKYIKSGLNPFLTQDKLNAEIQSSKKRLCVFNVLNEDSNNIKCYNNVEAMSEDDWQEASNFAKQEDKEDFQVGVQEFYSQCPHPRYMLKHARNISILDEFQARKELEHLYYKCAVPKRSIHTFFVGYSSYGAAYDVSLKQFLCFNEYPLLAFNCRTDETLPKALNPIQCKLLPGSFQAFHNPGLDGHFHYSRRFGTDRTIQTIRHDWGSDYQSSYLIEYINFLLLSIISKSQSLVDQIINAFK